jgi:hypothetical protein
MDFGTPAFSFSDDDGGRGSGGDGMTSTSVSEAEEMVWAVCDAVRRRRVEFDGNTWTGYGDSWLKTMERIDGLLRDFCSWDVDNEGAWCRALGAWRSEGITRLVTDSRDAVDGAGVKEREDGVLEIFGIGGGGGWGDGGLDPICKAATLLPDPEEIDSFRLLFHRDLMLLTGLSEALIRLFLPSSVESSEKRLDGGLDAASMVLARLSLRLCETEARCSGGTSTAEYLGCWSGLSKSGEGWDDDDGVEGKEGYRPKGSGDSGIMGELHDVGSRDEVTTSG